MPPDTAYGFARRAGMVYIMAGARRAAVPCPRVRNTRATSSLSPPRTAAEEAVDDPGEPPPPTAYSGDRSAPSTIAEAPRPEIITTTTATTESDLHRYDSASDVTATNIGDDDPPPSSQKATSSPDDLRLIWAARDGLRSEVCRDDVAYKDLVVSQPL